MKKILANAIAVRAALDSLEVLLTEPDLALPMGAFSSAKEGAMVARHILRGTIAEKNKQADEAPIAYQQAVAAEDELIYNEPRDWLLPARHFSAGFI
ncbi:MAG: hypothetical protein WKF97_26440 [Chitinophagaceae bacterium]